ncbi:tripeptidyl peptidase SED3 [Purpureocillium lavendulum]|uniref:Tripeptidyl peptidase SED3 n=1 Tax=Purpureocillium lavendulum TaxID=1247861 RepID=A0AB34FMK9_9HYPO|nr:tripeptidyl peptidase SED3 [Purpureocillium lavendulum]
MASRGGLPTDYFVASQQFTRTTHHDVYPAIDPAKSSNSLAGKIVIITGASRGIGAMGLVPSFAKAGALGLVLVARDEVKLRAVESEVHRINPGVKTLVAPLDMTDTVAVQALYATIQERFGRHADVLVSNAGANTAQNGGGPSLHKASVDEWWINFEVNVKAYFIMIKYLISSLPTPTTPVTVINISTGAIWLRYPMVDGYSVSKLAAQQWSVLLDAAYGGSVTVVGIHPGLVATEMQTEYFSQFDQDSPLLVGGVAVWAAADAARCRFLSGRIVSANWDVDELRDRAEEIEEGDLLKMVLNGELGREQFGTS